MDRWRGWSYRGTEAVQEVRATGTGVNRDVDVIVIGYRIFSQ